MSGKGGPSVQALSRGGAPSGMADAWAAGSRKKSKRKVTSGNLRRGYLKNNYLYRMAAAALGIYGNSKQEAMYPIYAVDAEGQKLDGANRYALSFAPGELPPVNAFWSLTMYECRRACWSPIRSTATCSTRRCCRSS
jgi:hypothetical protein